MKHYLQIEAGLNHYGCGFIAGCANYDFFYNFSVDDLAMNNNEDMRAEISYCCMYAEVIDHAD